MEAILRVESAIKAIKNGEMIIVMDDEDRENEILRKIDKIRKK